MKFKAFLLTKGISESQFEEKTEAEKAKLHGEFLDQLAKSIEDLPKSDDLDTIKTSIENLKKEGIEKSKFDTLVKQFEDIAIDMEAMKNRVPGDNENKSIAEQIKEVIEANKKDFESLKTSKGATMTFTVKAAADMLISTNTTGRVARIETEAQRNRIVRRRPFVLDSVTVTRTTANTLYWVDQVNPDGTPEMTAEGATKAQIDWDYIERSVPIRKITAFTKVSKEMLEDIEGFAQDIQNELEERILLVADQEALTGSGTGDKIIGISVNATPFAAGGLADSVVTPNDTDVLRAAIAQVYRQEFIPTKIFIHPDKAAIMDLQKGTDGHYLLAPFITADGMNVRGVAVEMNTGVGINDFYVGDFSKYKFKIREDISMQLGYDGNDWTKNMITPLAEMRGAGYISSTNYGAIVKGSFTAAKALLATV
jgi:hypothetical protein